jgi:flagellar motor component MotA
MSRKAITIKLPQNGEITFQSGSSDRNELKSSFFVISGHLTVHNDNPKKRVSRLVKEINSTISKYEPKDLFDYRKILDSNIPYNMDVTKKGFVSIEFTHYHRRKTNIKELRQVYEDIADKIFKENIMTLTDIDLKPGKTIFY